MNELALFAGAGGGILGGHLLGWRTVCAVEWERYPRDVLLARQDDGCLPLFPIWDDVQTFDGRPWRGVVDVVSGGFPCQDISAAGKGAGINGERSGMWAHMARIIREVGPRYCFVENSPVLTSRGLGQVLGDLAALGYDARWGVLGAVDVGAPHKRDRIWIRAELANATSSGLEGQQRAEHKGRRVRFSDSREDLADTAKLLGDGCDNFPRISLGRQSLPEFRNSGGSKDLADADSAQCSRVRCAKRSHFEHADAHASGAWWGQDPAEASESDVGRMANGVAARVDRLKAIGNGQVPSVAALAWRLLN
jgi:DNA (cytosine-5)-methyltransferase 1